jgi:hypothetical protein
MAKPETLVVDGRGFNWQRLCELRRQQLDAWRASQAQQLTLFAMREDCRPDSERTSAGRYEAPTMLELMRGAK